MSRKAFTTSTPNLRLAAEAFQKGDFLQALKLCDECLRVQSKDVNARHLKGRCLTMGGLFELAKKELQAALALMPNNPGILVSLAKVDVELGDTELGIAKLSAALHQKPDHEEAALTRGYLLERLGRIEQAMEDLQKITDASPLYESALRGMSLLHLNAREYSLAIDWSQKILDRVPEGNNLYREAAMIQGRALDKLGEVDKAMISWNKANRDDTVQFDREEFAYRIHKLIDIYPSSRPSPLPQSTCKSCLPVFIIGMPRSGTTLVEQIVGSHRKTLNVGEIRHIEVLASSLPKKIQSQEKMPDCLLELDTGKLNSLAADHLGDLARINKGNFSRVINKSLENYWHVGLLHQMYPKAKFIFVHRDPMDIGLSVFSNSFNTRKFPYAYTNKLRDIGFAYRHIKKLMDHWVKTFSDSILEVEYEQILKTPEETARQLISHLDLEWDENCLEFHKKKNLVLTLSYAQVNQPIYTSSMGRWKPYERHLAELQESLKEG